MLEKDLFSSLVKLYRELGEIAKVISYECFETTQEFEIKKSTYDALKELEGFLKGFGFTKVVSVQVDYLDKEYLSQDDIGRECNSISIDFSSINKTKSRADRFYFFDGIRQLIKDFSVFLSRGEKLPRHYYLFSDDISSIDEQVSKEKEAFDSVVDWISLLTSLSDINKDVDDGQILYFYQKSEGEKISKPFRLDVSISSSFYSMGSCIELGEFESLKSGGESKSLHVDEKRSVFKLALVEVLKDLSKEGGGEDLFYKLFCNLGRLRSSYYEHYQVFVNNFALSEFHRELEGAYFDYLEKIQGVLGDIQAKMYAVPAALIGMAALSKYKDVYPQTLILFGVLITCVLTTWMLVDQFKRLDSIKDSIGYIFKQFSKKGDEKLEHKEVVSEIENMKVRVEQQINSRRNKIFLYLIVCWSPMLIGVWFYLNSHGNLLFVGFVDFLLGKG